ncbi:MAG: MBL fold metallo-hydrolase [Patescibacteria group bacterium]
MKLTFLGASHRVTGSNYLLEAGGKKLLIDCGLFQGDWDAHKKNYNEFTFDPKSIDAVLVTHSHIDHIGRIPKLFRDGFEGKVYSTHPVQDFAALFLGDQLKFINPEEDPDQFHPEPLWEETDLNKAIQGWEGKNYHEPMKIGDVTIVFLDAGHILGSSIIMVEAEGKVISFSGDLGNDPVPIVPPIEKGFKTDYVVMESTYGDRNHENIAQRALMLEKAIKDVQKSNGVLLVPAFAMERTQELLYEINHMVETKQIEPIQVFVDSPLAIKATAIYKKYESYFDVEARDMIKAGDDIFNFPGLVITRTPEESRQIAKAPGPKVIIAGSGMSNGGRILFHERNYLGDPTTIMLFVGFQVKGTLGRKIKDGQKNLRILGQPVQIRAEIREIAGYSAHADQSALIRWLSSLHQCEGECQVKKVFLTHGELTASQALSTKIKDTLDITSIIPIEGETFEL